MLHVLAPIFTGSSERLATHTHLVSVRFDELAGAVPAIHRLQFDDRFEHFRVVLYLLEVLVLQASQYLRLLLLDGVRIVGSTAYLEILIYFRFLTISHFIINYYLKYILNLI